jgi:hypothetical protein
LSATLIAALLGKSPVPGAVPQPSEKLGYSLLVEPDGAYGRESITATG